MEDRDIDLQLALQDLAYGHGMLAALKFAEAGNPDRARIEAERQITEALKTLSAAHQHR